jgi:hypothetical protein
LSGTLSRDNALDNSGSRDCEGLNKHNFLSTCFNGASEWLVVRFKDRMWKLLRSEAAGGVLAPTAKGKCLLGPTLGRETKALLTVGEEPRQKS